jgi:hypothetical protein
VYPANHVQRRKYPEGVAYIFQFLWSAIQTCVKIKPPFGNCRSASHQPSCSASISSNASRIYRAPTQQNICPAWLSAPGTEPKPPSNHQKHRNSGMISSNQESWLSETSQVCLKD